jgi:hypothetical protein
MSSQTVLGTLPAQVPVELPVLENSFVAALDSPAVSAAHRVGSSPNRQLFSVLLACAVVPCGIQGCTRTDAPLPMLRGDTIAGIPRISAESPWSQDLPEQTPGPQSDLQSSNRPVNSGQLALVDHQSANLAQHFFMAQWIYTLLLLDQFKAATEAFVRHLPWKGLLSTRQDHRGTSHHRCSGFG